MKGNEESRGREVLSRNNDAHGSFVIKTSIEVLKRGIKDGEREMERSGVMISSVVS